MSSVLRRDEYSSYQILLFVALGRLLGAFLPPERVSARGGGSLSGADLAPSYGQGGLSRRPNPRLPTGRVTPYPYTPRYPHRLQARALGLARARDFSTT